MHSDFSLNYCAGLQKIREGVLLGLDVHEIMWDSVL